MRNLRFQIAQILIVFLQAISVLAILLTVFHANIANGQPRPTTPVGPRPIRDLSLAPLEVLNISLDGVAKRLSSPRGTPPVPGFSVPRALTKTFLVRTRGGTVDIFFAVSLPDGIPPATFRFENNRVRTPNAVGRLLFAGCPTCPSRFEITIRATSGRFQETRKVEIRIQPSTGRPNLISVDRAVNADDDAVEPAFDVTFEPTTFYPEDSRVIGRYSGGLNYRLIPNANSAIDEGRMRLIIPRLRQGREVGITLTNVYGSSETITITLPLQLSENRIFNQVNASDVVPPANINDTFSVRHDSGVLGASGRDAIPITPLFDNNRPQCNQRDFFFTEVTAAWLDENDQPTNNLGAVRVLNPIVNRRMVNNNFLIADWRLNPLTGVLFYQFRYRGLQIVLTCPDRIIN